MSKGKYENSTQMSKMLPASNIYRVGDYVFVETQPSYPYQIRRIEELTKTSNGQVEAKVSCFYRRRDLSNALVGQADKHAISAEEEGEINVGTDNLTDEESHQMKHREVFLSRQLEIINANTIRGKCSVTLYSEVEKLLDYLGKDDWFYYLLVYDPQQKTLLADRGEIGVGDEYQCETPKAIIKPSEDTADPSDYETLVWDPNNPLSDKQIDQFLVIARSIGTFARALDSSSSIKEPSLNLSAASASRDVTLFHALSTLHKNGYDLGKGITGLIPDGGPVLCRDEMEEWSSGEATLFEEGVKKHGKEFIEIQQEYLPWKSISQLVEYYYMWKTTDKYVQQKRLKAAEGDSKVTQIFIPSSNTAINLTLAIQATSQYQVTPTGNLVSPNYMCESCYSKDSVLWYPWGSSSSQPHKLYLCKDCWVYWKKCGGLKKSTKSSDSENTEPLYKCRICHKKFNRAERLSSHMTTHRGYDCTEPGCGKTFTLKTHLTRHLAKQHMIHSMDSKMKVKTPFVMTPTPLMKATRHICKDKLRIKHYARRPTDEVDSEQVKTMSTQSVTAEKAKILQNLKKSYKPKPLEEIVEIVKKIPRSQLKLTVPSSSLDSSDVVRSSPSSRAGLSPFQQAPASITQNLKAKHLKSPTPIAPGQKRHGEFHESEMPPNKRQPQQLNVNSPLGRKGYACNLCNKVLHSEILLQHHMQIHHGNAGPQIHMPPPPDPHKRHLQPYHHEMPPHAHPQYQPSHPHPPAPYQHRDVMPNGHMQGHMPPQRHSRPGMSSSGGTSRKQSYKGIVQQNRRDADMQYVDPPQEFLFTATKDSKKSRRSLPARVQRKIARKPFVQIKCSQELKDAIMCAKNEQKPKSGNMIVIDDD